MGRHGLPAPYRDQKRPIGDVTAGLDLCTSILDQAERSKLVTQWAAAARKELGAQTPKTQAGQLWVFGVMNYPLPK